MRLTCGGQTDPGRRRSNNEDSFCARADLGLFVVADGMGGHVAGEIASRLVVEAVEQFVTPGAAGAEAAGGHGERLRAGLIEGNRRIRQQALDNTDLCGMATTVVALLADAAGGAIAHVGDSRAYRRRDGALSRLTEDHSWVEEQIRAGALSEAEARRHPWRHIVTRAMAGGDDLEVEVAPLDLQPGDRVLLCSDGLSNVVSEADIAEVLGRSAPLDGLCAELVRRANAAGGPDNVTVVVIDVDAG